MATTKLKVTVSLDIIKKLKEINRPRYSKALGNLIIVQAKEFIARGISPVRGYGRFVEYSGQSRRRNNKNNMTGYPYDVMKDFPNKKVRPVNLELSGDMLDALEVKALDSGLRVGIFDSKQREKAEKHNDGDSTKNIPRRHFWPTREGEEFAVSIQRAIKDFYSDLLDKIIRTSK